jgi:hypothetical protein
LLEFKMIFAEINFEKGATDDVWLWTTYKTRVSNDKWNKLFWSCFVKKSVLYHFSETQLVTSKSIIASLISNFAQSSMDRDML